MQAREKSGSKFTNIVVAEGACEVGRREMYQDNEAMRLGGVGVYVRNCIEEMTGKESRCVVLGHLQRGGSPNAFDRMLGTNFGACAVRAWRTARQGKWSRSGRELSLPCLWPRRVRRSRRCPSTGSLVRTARDIGISFAAPKDSKFGETTMYEARTKGHS